VNTLRKLAIKEGDSANLDEPMLDSMAGGNATATLLECDCTANSCVKSTCLQGCTVREQYVSDRVLTKTALTNGGHRAVKKLF